MVRRCLLLAFCLAGITVAPVSAAAKPVQGITISPFQQQVSLAPDDPDQTFDLTLTNNTATIQEIGLAPHDFGSLNDTGGVLLEGAKSTYTQKYGLVSWLGLGTNTVVLNPGENRAIPITIQNRTSLQPGGHYGAVVASVNSLDDTKKNKVVLNQQLLSLIFVKKVGGEKYDLKLSDVQHNGNLLHLPNDITLRFQNPGNIHVVPRGIVKLKSPGGKVLAQGIINSESAFILPETYRQLYVPLTRVATAPPLPGLYTIDVEYRYDGITSYARKSTTLNFVSLPTYAAGAIALALLSYIIRRYIRSQKTSA